LTRAENQEFLEELMVMKKRMESLYAESVAKLAQESSADAQTPVWLPLADVYETEDAWAAVVDLPGVLEENLEVKVERSRLVIQGTRDRLARQLHDGTGMQGERPVGRFCRELTLPENLAGDQIRATLNRGVLTVEIAKKVHPVRKIAVRHD